MKGSKFKKYWQELVILILIIANLTVWQFFYEKRSGNLHVYFLDVGQGEAILVETPSHKKFLLDGGPDKRVMSEIGRVLPFGDQSIDVVIESHPDKDHIGGLPEVMERYKVGIMVEPGVESDNFIDDELHARAEKKNVPTLLARRGMTINFGDGAALKILFPNGSVENWETNDASIVARLEYGKKSFLLTGDSPTRIENLLINLDKKILDVDVLKAGHHGSRTSTSLAFVQAVSPEYVIISAGSGNTYGHPHREVLDILEKAGVKIVATEDVANLEGVGTVEFETDGETLKFKN